MIIQKTDKNSVALTASCLKQGNVCIIPTDTVYGFSGIVDTKKRQFQTDSKIRSIKGRSETKPFIYLIDEPEKIKLYSDAKIPDEILNLWPGPLTIIVPIKPDSDLVSAFSTVAFRCPGDAWLRNVIKQVGAPIFSTSVNYSGQPVCETEQDIIDNFEKSVDLVVCDGDKIGSVPSTIISISDNTIKVIRYGAVRINPEILISK